MCSLISYTRYIWLLFMSLGFYAFSYAQNDSAEAAKKAANTVFNDVDPLLVAPIKERHIADTLLNAIKKDDAFWYVNAKPQRKSPASTSSGLLWLLQQNWFKLVVWIVIIGGFTAVLIWYIATSNVKLFRRASGSIINKAGDDFTEDIFSLNYEVAIQTAISNQNFRMAVRLLFLQTLKVMAENKIIQYKADRTDSDYLQQLYNTSYYKDFFSLTRSFEYIWYGQIDVPEPAFYRIKSDFELFKKGLPV